MIVSSGAYCTLRDQVKDWGRVPRAAAGGAAGDDHFSRRVRERSGWGQHKAEMRLDCGYFGRSNEVLLAGRYIAHRRLGREVETGVLIGAGAACGGRRGARPGGGAGGYRPGGEIPRHVQRFQVDRPLPGAERRTDRSAPGRPGHSPARRRGESPGHPGVPAAVGRAQPHHPEPQEAAEAGEERAQGQARPRDRASDHEPGRARGVPQQRYL